MSLCSRRDLIGAILTGSALLVPGAAADDNWYPTDYVPPPESSFRSTDVWNFSDTVTIRNMSIGRFSESLPAPGVNQYWSLPMMGAFLGDISIAGAEFVSFEAPAEATYSIWYEQGSQDWSWFTAYLAISASQQGTLPDGMRLRLGEPEFRHWLAIHNLGFGYEITGGGLTSIELSTDGGDTWSYGVGSIDLTLTPEPASLLMLFLAGRLFLRRRRD